MDEFNSDAFQSSGKIINSVMSDLEKNDNSLRSSFSGASFPGSPVNGQPFYNTSTKKFYIYASGWVEVFNFTTSKLGSGITVATANIDDLAVTQGKVALLAVDTAQLAAGAVETAKIANDAVDGSKVDYGVLQRAHIRDTAAGYYSITGTFSGAEAAGSTYADWTQVSGMIASQAGEVRVAVGYKNSNATGSAKYRIKVDGSVVSTSDAFSNTATERGYYTATISSVGTAITIEASSNGTSSKPVVKGALCVATPDFGAIDIRYEEV